MMTIDKGTQAIVIFLRKTVFFSNCAKHTARGTFQYDMKTPLVDLSKT